MKLVKSSAVPDCSYAYDKPLYRADSALGWLCIKGVHEPKIISMTGEWRTRVTINAEGYRITSHRNNSTNPKRKIWIYGCSYTFGDWLENDESTFAYLIQEALPDAEVRNFGIPAYGTTHSILQLSEHLKHETPDAVIFCYYRAHQWRNTASPHWLKILAKEQDKFNGPTIIPKAWISEEGEISIGYVNIVNKHLEDIDPQVIETAPWYNYQLLQFLYKYVQDLSRERGFKFISGTFSHDTFFKTLQDSGVDVVHLGLEDTAEYLLLPYDVHPNARANRIFADRLLERIES